MSGRLVRHPVCPHCGSSHVTPSSGKKLFITLAGGLLGGVLTGLLTLSDKTSDKRASVGAIIFGIFTGGTAGFKYGEAHEDFLEEKPCLCLTCFRFFTYQPQSLDTGAM
jgi:hypothetical protein